MKRRFLSIIVILVMVLGSFGLSKPALSYSNIGPGTKPEGGTISQINGVNSIVPFYVDTGRLGASVDALGTITSSGTVTANKPNVLSTVHKAYLIAATTGFFYYADGPLADGDILINSIPVNWILVNESSIASYNHLADVTWLVKPVYDLSLPGDVSFSITELNTYRVDGTVLIVIYNNPLLETENTIAISFGAQNVYGDTFELNFSDPIDLEDPNLKLEMSLGISFGAQQCASGQYSIVDVNEIRLSSSAGGEDDGVCTNGALITAGGLGDSTTNPTDPYSTDNGDPRQDDELYDLKPFISDGDTNIKVATVNPSTDDNIFMAVFQVSGTAAVSVEPQRPVIFIPGFMGSELDNDGEEIWPNEPELVSNIYDEHLDALILDEYGLDPEGSLITVGDDIVRNLFFVIDVYGGVIKGLEELGYTEGENLFIFPYDFRKDIRTSANLLESKIRELTGGELRGIDIIAHSQGGLVTKACILTPSCAELVNNAAIIGTPFAGTTSGARVLEYGQPLPDNILGSVLGVNQERAKIISQNWSNIYQLVASPNYYSLFGREYFIYDRDLDGDGDNEGPLDYTEMKVFLAARHNSYLVDIGEEFLHTEGVDTWEGGTNGVNVVIFAGTGLNTLTTIRESEIRLGFLPPIVHVDFTEEETGDETVTTFSVALKNGYGVDYTYDNVNVFYVDKVNHTNLPKHPVVLQYITTIFSNAPSSTTINSTSAVLELPPPPQEILTEPTYVNGRQFLFNGDLQVQVFDEAGGRTGKNPDDTITREAEGTSFTQIGDATSIFIYGSGTYTLTIDGKAQTIFGLKIRTVDESVENQRLLYSSVELGNEEANGKMVYDTSVEASEVLLEIDQDGDGIFETILSPDSEVTEEDLDDIIPPNTEITLTGDMVGEYYRGAVEVTLTAQDDTDGSGVAKIFYSIDDCITFTEYMGSFSISSPGVTEIYAYAVDRAGNIESDAAYEIVHRFYINVLPMVIR